MHCIDNGPVEGFWGIQEREMYYGRKYNTCEGLILAIKNYIRYYNNERIKCDLHRMMPKDFHDQYEMMA